MKPMPHSVSSTRVPWTDGETYTTGAAVLSEEPCLITPKGERPLYGTMGPAEMLSAMIYIGPDADIEMQDILTDDSTGIKWKVVEQPVTYENPRKFGTDDHIQAKIERLPIQ